MSVSILSVNQAINQEFGLQLAEGQEHIETDARAIEASACSGVLKWCTEGEFRTTTSLHCRADTACRWVYGDSFGRGDDNGRDQSNKLAARVYFRNDTDKAHTYTATGGPVH